NLIQKTEIATGIVTLYSYDYRNRLVGVVVKGADGTVLKSVTYRYDAFDRRIQQSVDADGAGSAPAVVTSFVHDPNNTWADYNAGRQVTARYLHGARTDQLLARVRPGYGLAWYLTDRLGSVRDIANAAGQVINHIVYSSFGQVVSQTNPAASDRFLFT